MRKLIQISGTLSTEGGDVFLVLLNLTVAELGGGMGIESQAVARAELATDLRDGNYMLDYTFLEPFHGPVREQDGALTGFFFR